MKLRLYTIITFLVFTLCAASSFAQNKVYLRSSTNAPWWVSTNEAAMNTVFGAGNWQDLRYQTVNVSTLLSSNTSFIFMEGGADNDGPLQTFLTNNRTAIESWVNNGGKLFLNAATWSVSNMNYGFNGTSLVNGASGSAYAKATTHAIFQGPYTPVGTSWTGSSFSHNYITGTGLTAVINDGSGRMVLAEKAYGSGIVLFGGITTDNFHQPQPQASNLRKNIIYYLGNGTPPAGISVISTSGNAVCTGINSNISIDYKKTGTYNSNNTFTAELSDANGNFGSPVNIGTLNSTTDGTIYATIPAATTPGTGYKIRIVSSNPVVTGSTYATAITVNALPEVTLADLNAVCADAAAVDLTGGSPAGGTYFGTGVRDGKFNPAVAGVGTFEITYKYTNGNGCTNYAKKNITVNALPEVTLADLNAVCVDASAFDLIGGMPTGGMYSGTGVNDGKFNPAIAGVGTFEITYSFKDGNGCKSSAKKNITVNALPEVTLADLNAVCEDAAAFDLTGGLPAGGTYSGTGVSSGKFNPATGAGIYEITYSYTNGNGCTSTAKKSITVNALPTGEILAGDGNGGEFTATNNKKVLYGASGYDYVSLATNNIPTGAIVRWFKRSATATSNSTTPFSTSTSVKDYPKQTTIYTLEVENTSGCVISSEAIINVLDVRCGNKLDKISICHKGKDICVDLTGMADHLAHGCTIGTCASVTSGKMIVKKSSGNDNAKNTEEGLAEATTESNDAVLENADNNIFGNTEVVTMNGALKLTASPNPFNSSTLIELISSESNNISLGVYDIRGVMISQLYNGNITAGSVNKITFDGAALRSGIYFVRAVSGSEVKHIKLILAK